MTAALWGQAGNAALLAGHAEPARADLTAALTAAPAAPAETRAGWLIDRARAAVALKDLAAARVDLDKAVALSPRDATALTLSAALAARQGDGARARREILEARRLAPADPLVAAEAKRIGVAAIDSPSGRAAAPVSPVLNPPY